MKHVPAPTCPRCNSSDDVKNVADGLTRSSQQLEISHDGFVLDGHCVRPNSPEWYCSVCEESFAGGREFWGNPLTDLLQ
jgi:ribosomal protein L37AE/L43A